MATHTSDPDREESERSGTEHAGKLPAHVVDGLLASRARRRLLRRLREAGEPVPVDDLAGAIAASPADSGDGDGGDVPTDRRRARTDIYQQHLPRLMATGVVAFDSRLGTVEFTGGARLAARLDSDREIGVGTEDK